MKHKKNIRLSVPLFHDTLPFSGNGKKTRRFQHRTRFDLILHLLDYTGRTIEHANLARSHRLFSLLRPVFIMEFVTLVQVCKAKRLLRHLTFCFFYFFFFFFGIYHWYSFYTSYTLECVTVVQVCRAKRILRNLTSPPPPFFFFSWHL